MARSVASTRASGQPAVSAASIAGSSVALVADHAGDDVAEEGRVGVAVLVAVDFLAEPVGLELGDHLGKRRAAEVHLVERLHGGEPGGTALVGRPLARADGSRLSCRRISRGRSAP